MRLPPEGTSFVPPPCPVEIRTLHLQASVKPPVCQRQIGLIPAKRLSVKIDT